MNMQKIKALLVTGKRLRKRMVQDTEKPEAKTDNAEIEQVANHELLGMIIDEYLTCEVHVDVLCNKLSERLGLLRRIRTIQMDASDYTGLESETIDNNKLEVSWTMKPPTTRAIHGGRQKVFEAELSKIVLNS